MKLSIITINLNNLDGLKLTYKSIQNQSTKNIEWIVIDGGSIDGSVQYIEELIRKPDIFVSESDNGIYHAMNKGTHLANGEYVIFMNSGDQFADNILTDNFLLELNNEIIYGDALVTYENIDFNYSKQPDNLSILNFYRSCICHQATFIKHDVQLRFPFDENYKYASCRKFFLDSIIFGNVNYKYLNIPICIYDLNGVSSKSKEKLNKEEDIYIRDYLPNILINDLNNYRLLTRIKNNSRIWSYLVSANDYRFKKIVFENIIIFISKLFNFRNL
jgi:glycosyltransferase involved in cell wall biosynthesis